MSEKKLKLIIIATSLMLLVALVKLTVIHFEEPKVSEASYLELSEADELINMLEDLRKVVIRQDRLIDNMDKLISDQKETIKLLKTGDLK